MNIKKKYIWLMLLVFVGGGVAFGVREYTRGNDDLADATPQVTITAIELMNAYSSDEAAANATYLNKVVRVSGTIRDIKQDSLGSYSIDLESGSDLGVVSCLLDTRHNDDAKGVQPGSTVSITGLCTGALMDVVLVRCAIN